jgi:hypothetical protein
VSYLLQTDKNKELGHRHALFGDVVVGEDLRSAYDIAKDGSRRRIKDPAAVAHYVATMKKYLEREAPRIAEEKAKREAQEAGRGLELALATGRKDLPNTLAMLMAGGAMGASLLAASPGPRRIARIGE